MKQGSHLSYVYGFLLSLVLTLAAYMLVTSKVLTGSLLIATVTGLALTQLLIQLILFLHLGSETKPRWNQLTFVFTVVVAVILVFGSVWIMNNLNYHMTPQEMNQQMFEQSKSGGF